MASQQPNEVEEVIKELKQNPGFDGYVVMNNDGIVIKCENMEYKTAVHHAHLVLDLCAKSRKYMRDLLDPPDNEVESIRLRTIDYEMIIAQHDNFTLVVIQKSHRAMNMPVEEEEDEKKEEA
uniref:Roadblock/LAMTOR2 domain-containing protein n=1 Tax=Heterosigma akashiwo TaxID=2829 RepID=A0A6V1PEV3_HETAK|mmetsp:Transcript_25034/g.45535  ORF Transcript_25034/g.45535 Transcript_25034/m.45535 type:complete len:122 (-) Transcript_25034:11-376(-)